MSKIPAELEPELTAIADILIGIAIRELQAEQTDCVETNLEPEMDEDAGNHVGN